MRRIILDLAPPGMEDQAPDRERLERALLKAGVVRPVFGLPVLRDLAQTLRDCSFKCAVTLIGDEVVDVRPQPGGGLLGMAFDIGTTTVVGYLIDLASGRELAVASALNPQVRHGFDVISRIVYGIEEPDGVETLSRLIRDLIGRLIGEACTRAGVSSSDVYEICVAGNTTMTHLFLGIDPHYLGLAPYVPVTSEAVEVKAGTLGLPMHPGGSVYVLPGIGGFIGADTTGVIVSTRFEDDRGAGLAIDIGTNGEVVGRDRFGRLFRPFDCRRACLRGLQDIGRPQGHERRYRGYERIGVGAFGQDYRRSRSGRHMRLGTGRCAGGDAERQRAG